MRKPLKQLLAEVDPALVKKLKVKLARDGQTYRQWLEKRIREYTTHSTGDEK